MDVTKIKNIYIKKENLLKKIEKGYIKKDSEIKLIYDDSGILPSDYTQVEYIEKDDIYSYIDTGLKGVKTIECEISGPAGSGAGSSSKIFFGFRSLDYESTIYYSRSTLTINVTNGNINNTIEYTPLNRVFYNISYYSSPAYSVYINNELIKTFNESSYYVDKNIPLILFSEYTNFNQTNDYKINSSTATGLRIKSCKIYNDINKTQLLRNFIPCIDKNNVIGLYDIVEGIFYTNSSTQVSGQPFIAGPIVQ